MSETAMLAFELLDGPRHLTFMTRKGGEITYGRGKVMTAAGLRQTGIIEDKYPHLTRRKGPSCRYNCHALTFANRRGHFEPTKEQLATIFEDDEYFEVAERDVMVGDIVAYSGDLGLNHTGVVVCVEREPNVLAKIMVLSKWGSASEFIHQSQDCYYLELGDEIRYYREGKSDGNLAES